VKRPSFPHRPAGFRSRRVLGLVLSGLVFSLAVATACSNQGEGERCESANGNEDCKTDEGLICFEAAKLQNSDSDRCCPVDRSKATAAVCKTQVNLLDAAGVGTVPDTGSTTTEPDSSSSTTDDGGNDGSSVTDAADQ
jgi:hypothetical protein